MVISAPFFTPALKLFGRQRLFQKRMTAIHAGVKNADADRRFIGELRPTEQIVDVLRLPAGFSRVNSPATMFARRNSARCRSNLGNTCHWASEAYRGRVGIFELLNVDDAVRDGIQSRANATDIRDRAVRAGMRSLRDDGLLKIASGMTTPGEVQRVTVRATM